MKWFRKLIGMDFPPPEVGDIWQSRHSRRCVYVESVEVMDDGMIRWAVLQEVKQADQHDYTVVRLGKRFSRVALTGYGLFTWRTKLKNEGRKWIGFDVL